MKPGFLALFLILLSGSSGTAQSGPIPVGSIRSRRRRWSRTGPRVWWLPS